MTPPWPPTAATSAIHGLLRELRRGGTGDDEAFVRRVMRALDQPEPVAAPGDRGSAGGRTGWPRWLAAAAGLALAVAGGLWLYPRLAGPPALGLRLVELQGAVAVTRAGVAVPVRQGLALQDGDRVTVAAGGTAALTYDGEPTRVELQAAAATFRAEKGAKRVRLDAGLLVCTAAPQRQPFRLETPDATAEVVGTRFWLDVAQAETALAVREGKVALRQKDKSLDVRAGETAVADAAGLRNLSPADAWLRDLLVRAGTGSWAALDFQQGAIVGDPGGWRLDRRGAPAAWRLWQTAPQASSMVMFDAAKWKRGVVVGRVMILPEGPLPAALAVPAEATAPSWKTEGGMTGGSDLPNGAYLAFHWQAATGRTIEMEHLLTINKDPRGVWHRFALYFDTDTKSETVAGTLRSVWPAERAVPPAAQWLVSPRQAVFGSASGSPLGLGLVAKGVPALWQGVKVVPLGPDLPPPPGR